LQAESRWRFEAAVGARAPTGAKATFEPRAALGASVWPSALGGHGGFGLDVFGGPGVSVGTGAFQGELLEEAVDVTFRLRGVFDWFALELQVGPALVLSSIDGKAIPTGASEHAVRLDPAIDANGVADVVLGRRVTLGALAGTSARLRFQRYSLDGATLLDEPVVGFAFGARLALGLDSP
jgi:hypothetical protein